ncbi:DNA-binding NarL/FixJ family response regulator [Halopolyspora algeriensis]|uniref:DNA-binding NarL/FixJ family response regulator n=1 Tax=Halopolyspora algeriensis TaxID=1500506 RepID=A0A368VTE6_9ACTN|nr:response regulator transcription factor [Halopolyspora algeriensis]RCW45260.1 DNA-binding NarL/FixJ family response regulator [Halopolyspora algeriensis]TQM53021.1 DNA-binding NarL/FixJ family response regulator [Halopolyspora algeriensis]
MSVLVIDDHQLVTASLVMALRAHSLDAHRCPVFDVEGVLDEADKHTPGLALVDLELGNGDDGRPRDGADLVGPLCQAGWSVVVVSGSTQQERVAAAIAAGANGWVPKSESFDDLLNAALAAANGKALLTPEQRKQWLALHRESSRRAADVHGRLDRLSTREREVLERLAQGQRAATIAQEFYISLATVRTQIRSILTKLDVGSQLEAVALHQDARR